MEKSKKVLSRLQRRGQKNDGQYGKVDNLTLHYDGNRLVAVEDDAAPVTTYDSFDFRDGASQAVEYTYNGVGALTSDLNKGITAIAYDNLNNPCRIQFSGGNATEYVYSSDGRKLLTRHITGTAAILSPRLAASPQYVGHDSLVTGQPGILRTIADSTEYVGNAVFRNGQLERLLFPGGYVTLDSLQTPVFHYFTQDHLGNVRAVVREDGTVEQVTHYYPFGGVFGDAGSNADLQPYKYNCKELDRMHGLDWYDYGARMYDAQVVNWFRMDLLSEKYYGISPYVYCKNNPIKFIDLKGMTWTDINGNAIDDDDLDNICVFIFYSGDFEKQAKVQYANAVKNYGKGAVAWSRTDTKDNFKKDWGDMGKSTSHVIIMTHGKNQSIALGASDDDQITSTGSQNTNLGGTKDAMEISELKNSKVDFSKATLSMYSCHSADYIPYAHGTQGPLMGTNKQPIAEAFSEKFGFGRVIGTAGSVNYYGWYKYIFHPCNMYLMPYPENGMWSVFLPEILVTNHH